MAVQPCLCQSDLVENPNDRFSCDAAQLNNQMMEKVTRAAEDTIDPGIKQWIAGAGCSKLMSVSLKFQT